MSRVSNFHLYEALKVEIWAVSHVKPWNRLELSRPAHFFFIQTIKIRFSCFLRKLRHCIAAKQSSKAFKLSDFWCSSWLSSSFRYWSYQLAEPSTRYWNHFFREWISLKAEWTFMTRAPSPFLGEKARLPPHINRSTVLVTPSRVASERANFRLSSSPSPVNPLEKAEMTYFHEQTFQTWNVNILFASLSVFFFSPCSSLRVSIRIFYLAAWCENELVCAPLIDLLLFAQTCRFAKIFFRFFFFLRLVTFLAAA